jgi:hypothetical protein
MMSMLKVIRVLFQKQSVDANTQPGGRLVEDVRIRPDVVRGRELEHQR